MDRRTFLQCAGTVTLSGLSGCAAFGAAGNGKVYSLSLDSIPENDLAKSASLGPEEYTDEQRSVVKAAVNDSDARTYGYRPIDDGAYVDYEGRYYRASIEETGTKTLRRTTLRGEVVSGSEHKSEAVEILAYPGDDMKAVKYAVATADESKERFYVFHGRSTEDSALLPEPEHEYVEYDEEVVHLVVEERTVSETEYTYTLNKVASSSSAFVEYAHENIVGATFRNDELAEKQRHILEKAIESEDYTEHGNPSDEFEALLKRLRADGKGAENDNVKGTETDGIVTEQQLSEYAQYDGSYYKVSLSVGVR